ncbi:MAG: hypothetical protein AB8C02_06930 [Halioglobus sp.]
MLQHPLLRVLSVSLLALCASALVLFLLSGLFAESGAVLNDGASGGFLSGLVAGAVDGYLTDPALVALWAALAGGLLLLLGAVRRVFLRQALIATLVLPWLLMDFSWQRQLNAHVDALQAKFEGRSVHERHLGDVDGALYLFTTKVRRMLDDTQEHSRVLIVSMTPENADRNAKVAYFLLPHSSAVLPANAVSELRADDYILWISDADSGPPPAVAQARCDGYACVTTMSLEPYLIGQDSNRRPLYVRLHQVGSAKDRSRKASDGGVGQ